MNILNTVIQTTATLFIIEHAALVALRNKASETSLVDTLHDKSTKT